jgi:lipopolysaccharide biosynthesis glycosyltransferase
MTSVRRHDAAASMLDIGRRDSTARLTPPPTEPMNISPPIDVAIAADANYLQHAAVVAHSLLSAHRHRTVRLHFLHSGTSTPSALADLRSLVEAEGGQFIELPVPESFSRRLKPHPHFGTHAWMRMLLPDLLPGLDRVLYLDSDVVIRDRLDELWSLDLEGCWLAAVVNPLYPHQSLNRLAPLGIREPGDYFNSGVLLLDLKALREAEACSRLLTYADAHHERLLYPDQDVLNAVLRGRWKAVHPRYNAQSPIFDLRAGELPFSRAEIRSARRQPAIVHFSGLFKPWTDACGHPLRKLYWSHIRQTPWRDATPQNPYWRNKILRHFPYRLYRWYWKHFPQPQAQRTLTEH